MYWRQLDYTNGSPVHFQIDPSNAQAPDWRNSSNHSQFFDRLAQLMNVSQPTDWYKVKTEDVYKNGGRIVLQQYENSLYKVVAKFG